MNFNDVEMVKSQKMVEAFAKIFINLVLRVCLEQCSLFDKVTSDVMTWKVWNDNPVLHHDLDKIYDIIDHTILLFKLIFLGFSYTTTDFMASYSLLRQSLYIYIW